MYINSFRSKSSSGIGNPWFNTTSLPYIVNKANPVIITDFVNNYFSSSIGTTNFASMLDYTGASLKTMTDSDGKLKWGPHNFLPYSEDITQSVWNADSNTKADLGGGIGKFTSSLGGTFYPRNTGYTVIAGATYTLEVEVRSSGPVPTISLAAYDGTFKTSAAITLTSSFVKQTFQFTAASAAALGYGFMMSGAVGVAVEFRYMRLYRSDLGGMVNNPDTGNSYVPTTTSAVYLPRRGNYLYNGYASVNKGLLLESQARTNLLNYSEEFDNAYWTKTRCSITANNTTSPTGTMTADKFVENTTATETHNLVRNFVSAAFSGTVTLSIYAKADTRSIITLYMDNTAGTAVTYEFDLTALTKTNRYAAVAWTAHSAQIVDVGNGWRRCSITATRAATDALATRICIGKAGSTYDYGMPLYTGDGVSGLFIYGAQIEVGDTPSSYIPTTTAQVTRAAELLQVKAPNLAVGANDFTNTAYWPATSTQVGITATKTAGVDAQGPYCDINFFGTTTGISHTGFFPSVYRNPTAVGETYTASAIIERRAGTLTGIVGISTGVVNETAPNTFLGIQNSNYGTLTTPTLITATRTIPSGNQVRTYLGLEFTGVNVNIDITYRFRGFQFDKAASRLPYPDQSNVSMQIDGTMTGTPSTFTRWGGSLTNYLMQSASVGAYEFDTNPNLAIGAEEYTNTTYWPATSTQSEITCTRTAGVDATGPYADLRFTGTLTAAGRFTSGAFTPPANSAVAGDTYTISAIAQRVAGTEPSFAAFDLRIRQLNSAGSYLAQINSPQSVGTSPVDISVTGAMVANTAQINAVIQFYTTQIGTIDVTYRIRGLQLDKAASRLTYAGRGGSFTSGIDVPFNVASRHGATYINGAVNGTALTASSSTLPFPVLNASPIQLGPTFMGNISDFRQWNTDVGNTGIVAATAPSLLPSLNLNFDGTNSSFIVNDWSE